MVSGMGSLMGLCPTPDKWTIADWCQSFGVLPSQVTPEDWAVLATFAQKQWLEDSYRLWTRMVTNPKLGISMPLEVVQYLLALRREAKKQWSSSAR